MSEDFCKRSEPDEFGLAAELESRRGLQRQIELLELAQQFDEKGYPAPIALSDMVRLKQKNPETRWAEILLKNLEPGGKIRLQNITFIQSLRHCNESGPFIPLPFTVLSGGGYFIGRDEDSDFISDLQYVTKLLRLSDVEQLSFLVNPSIDPRRQAFLDTSLILPHTRYAHMLHTSSLAEIIGHINGWSPEVINKAVAATLVHDAATVAGGDVVKNAIPGRLSEERLLNRILTNPQALEFFAKNNLSISEVQDMVDNKGMLGEVLDFCDRLSYTILDVQAAGPLFKESSCTLAERSELGILSGKGLGVVDLLKKYPNFGDIIFDVRVDKNIGRMYVENSELLGVFLEMRAIMHRDLYMDPIARLVQEAVLVPLIQQCWKDGGLTSENLLQWGNADLQTYLAKRLNIGLGVMFGVYLTKQVSEQDIQVEVARSLAEAQEIKNNLERGGRRIVSEFNDLKGFNSSTHLLVKTPAGLKQFKDACPEWAQRINTIVDEAKRLKIYHAKKME